MNLKFLTKIKGSYKKFLISFVEKTDFELSFVLPKIDLTNRKEEKEYFEFYKSLEKKANIRFEYKNTRNGEVPIKLIFYDEKSYLFYIEKEKDFEIFRENYKGLKTSVDKLNNLNNWILKNILLISEYSLDFWKNIFLVVDYFLENKESNLYLRELDIKVDTKFIEKNKKIIKSILYFLLELEEKTNFEEYFEIKQKPQFIRFRFLDDNLKQKYFGEEIDDIYLRIENFEKLDFGYRDINKIFIVENEINYLTFPEIKNAIIIWGAGFKVNILKNTEFLKNTEIFYWGDIDSHGFKILANLRKNFPQTKSIFMNQELFIEFQDYLVEGLSLSEPEIEKYEDFLEKEEFELLKYVNKNNLRLEQENISQSYILENLFT